MTAPRAADRRRANGPVLVLAVLVVLAAVLSFVGLDGHHGQSVVVVGNSLTAQSTDQITFALARDGWKPSVEGHPGSSIGNLNNVFDWQARLAAIAATPPGVVVVELGTNDCGNCGEDLATAIDRLMRPLDHVRRVIWLNAQTHTFSTRDLAAVNSELRKATVRWPNLEILDMSGHFAGHPEWHTADSVHFSDEGQAEVGRFIRSALDAPPSRVGVLSAAV